MGSVRAGGPSVTGGILAGVVRLVLPSPCLACATLDPPLDMGLGLCPACRAGLKPVAGRRCARCLRPLGAGDDESPHCPPCAASSVGPDRLLAGWLYLPPADAVLRGLKFGGLGYLGRDLARHLERRFRRELAGIEVVVPVPLHWRRLLARGYNQAAEIARPLARRLGLPCRAALRRRRATAPQTRLPRARRAANVRGAFAARHPGAVRGRACLLVDDVVTTGATLAAAVEALRRAGAASVLALAAARRPGPDEVSAGKARL